MKSTHRRIVIFSDLAEQDGIDRCDLLNNLIYEWVIQRVDEELKPIITELKCMVIDLLY